MSALSTVGPLSPTTAPPPRRLRLDRLVTGGFLVVVGVAWMVDAVGVSVPWRLFPAVGLVIAGASLVVAVAAGWPRGGLVGLGAVLLVAAVAVGVHVERFAGPIGDQVLAPTGDEWPAQSRLAAGTATIDLTRHPLPPSGRLDVSVGAGRVILVLPRTSAVRVDTEVVAGAVLVDGVRVDDGIHARWAAPGPAPVAVSVDVVLGEVEVLHAQ